MISMRRSLRSVVDIRMCARYSGRQGHHQEVWQRMIKVMLCCTIHNRSLSELLVKLSVFDRPEDRHWPPSLATPLDAGCTTGPALTGRHPGIVSIWREIILCLSSYAGELWQQRTQSRWRISKISKEVLGGVVGALFVEQLEYLACTFDWMVW